MAQDIVNHSWFPKTEPPLSGGAESGTWQGRDRQSLGTIARSLVYEVADAKVNSLPSPWSRALQFEQAVLNTRYPTREALLEELFGGMACLGLWEMFGLRIDAQRVALLEQMDLQDDAVGPFSRSLASSIPDPSTAISRLPENRNPWEVIYVFSLEGSVIGFSSPSTLFCPAVHLPKPIRGMGWSGEGKFSSPLEFLSTPQRQTLADWFSHVRNGMLNARDLNSQTTAGQMAGVFDLWINRLSGGRLGTPTLSNGGQIANLPANPVAVALLARPAKGSISASQATLDLGDREQVPVAETPPVGKPVVLVDPDMPNKLGVRAADICLYKSATLEAIGFDPAQLERQYGQEIEVITPDDLFLDELYLVAGEEALMHSWLGSRLEGVPLVNGDPVTPLLPLKPKVRALFSSRELQERCELRVLQTSVSSQLELRLSLPLVGLRQAYVISRTYPLKEQNLVAEDLPVISLWPYVSDRQWSLYYLFCEDTSHGLTVDGFGDYDRKFGRDGQQAVKYFTSRHFPDLVRMSERGQDRGLLPVTPPPTRTDQGMNWRVGIDFGTSFTNFFVDDGGGPRRLQLDTRVVSLTLSQKDQRQRLLHQYFIPEEMVPTADYGGNPPTATAISLRGWQEVLGQVPELFHEARLRVPSPGEFGGSELRTGFKWEQLQYQKPFLKELALLISANAAASGARDISWSVSYPSAFSNNELARYRRVWTELCDELTTLTGLSQVLHQQGEAGLQTEAVAFASYFGNHQSRQMVHTSCMDVGGGTTDISIWQENRLIHQVSIPYAGRDICSKLLQLKPSFLKSLFPPSLTADINDDEARARQDRNFNSRLDNIMRYGSSELLAGRLDMLVNQTSPLQEPLQQFLSLIAISFGGLYHYLGRVHQVLRDEGKLARQTPTPVYLGGNGGRLINWMDGASTFQKGGDPDRLMELLQVKAAGCAMGSGSTTLSEAYKDETACGLISTGVNLKGAFDPRDDVMVCGANLQINTLSFRANDRVILPHQLRRIESYELKDLEAIKTFVEDYDTSIAELRIRSLVPIRQLCDLDQLWGDLETEVRSLCLAKVGKEPSDLEPEPGFVLGLRALTNCLGRQWAERF